MKSLSVRFKIGIIPLSINNLPMPQPILSTRMFCLFLKTNGTSCRHEKQALAIPASSEMQKFIFLRISQLQGRLLIIFLPMQNEEKASPETCYRGSTKLFEIILGLTSPSMIDISKFIESQNESQESFETVFKESWPETPSA